MNPLVTVLILTTKVCVAVLVVGMPVVMVHDTYCTTRDIWRFLRPRLPAMWPNRFG